MPFDPSTAIADTNTFDPSSATAFDPSSASPVIPKTTDLPFSLGSDIFGEAAGGVGYMAGMAAGATGAALDIALNKINPKYGNPTPPGMSLGDRFVHETQTLQGLASDAIPFDVRTDTGKAISSFLIDKILTPAAKGVGDVLNAAALEGIKPENKKNILGQKPGEGLNTNILGLTDEENIQLAAMLGATGQAGVVGAAFAAGPKGAKNIPKPEQVLTGNPATDFATQYPATARLMEATSIGDSPLQAAVKANPNQHIMKTVEDSLNKELGITPQILEAKPDVAMLTVGDKIKMLIQRASSQAKEPISLDEQMKISNGLVDQIFQLQQTYDAMQAAARPKGLPAPSPIEGTITVDKYGNAITPDQWGTYFDEFSKKSPQEQARIRAISAGQGPMGVINKDFNAYAAAKKLSDATEKPMDVMATRVADNALKDTWSKIFSFPKDTLARSNALEAYKQDPSMTYDEALAAVGPRKTTPAYNPEPGGSVSKQNALRAKLGPIDTTAALKGVIDTPPIDIFPEMQAANNQAALSSIGGKQKGLLDIEGLRQNAEDIKNKIPKVPAPVDMNRPREVVVHDLVDQGYTRPEAIQEYFNHQRGILDISGLDKNLPAAKKAAETAATKGWILANPEAAANKVKAAMDSNFETLDSSRKVFGEGMIRRARREVYAHNYDLQQALRSSGPFGISVLRRMSVQGGATMAAEMTVKEVDANIFSKFTHEERKSLDELTHLRRIVQIDNYKGPGVVRHFQGVTGPMAAARIEQMKMELGPEKFTKVNNGATSIFEQQLVLLDKLQAAGLETPELVKKLKGLDYQRTEYLNKIDPIIPIKSNVRGITDVRSSGIRELGHGKLDTATNMDAQQLLNEDIIRVENRIARNNTLSAVRDLAKENPNNDIVRIPAKESVRVDKAGDQTMRHTPAGWTSIGVRVGGKQEFVLMRDEMAEQFVNRPEAMPEWMAVAFRLASGSALIKATSTTYNPGFIVKGIPMDILHTWLADTNVYSPQLPKFLLQMGADMAATAKDSFKREGAWNDAMREGIGNSYMTHEPRSLLDPTKLASTQISRHFQKTRYALAYLGESADVWIRLAYRNRLMREGGGTAIDNATGQQVPVGLSSWEATAESRMRLDYAQGGRIAKAVDTFAPYTNVGIQGTGKVIEAAFRDPGKMATKIAWFTAAATSATLANMIASPDTQKAISASDKVRNFNITFGDSYYTLDQNGNKRYMYVPMRIDQTAMPLMAAVVGGLEKAEYGKVPDGMVGSAIGQVAPINKAIPIPSIDALATYFSNYDMFTGRQIYTGPAVKPESEIKTFGQGKPTGALAISAGSAMGASPMRLEAAASKLINTNNFYIQLMGGANKLLFAGIDPREQAASTMLMLQNVPGLHDIVKLTSPGIADMQAMKDAEEAAGSKIAPMKAGLDDLIFQYDHKQNGVNQETISKYINAQPPEVRQQLADHFQYGVKIDAIMKNYKASEGIPDRSWWIHSAKISPEVRGQVFYDKWVSASPADRDRMLGIANAMGNAGTGYMSEGFKKGFADEQKLLGTEQR